MSNAVLETTPLLVLSRPSNVQGGLRATLDSIADEGDKDSCSNESTPTPRRGAVATVVDIPSRSGDGSQGEVDKEEDGDDDADESMSD